MIAMWTALGIAIDAVPLAAAGDDLSEKADTTNAVILNLAVLISPDFDNGNQIVSPALQMSAVVQYKYVTSLYQAFTIPKKVVSSKGRATATGNMTRRSLSKVRGWVTDASHTFPSWH